MMQQVDKCQLQNGVCRFAAHKCRKYNDVNIRRWGQSNLDGNVKCMHAKGENITASNKI